MFLKGKKQQTPASSSSGKGAAASAAPAASGVQPGVPAKKQPSGVPSIVSADLRIEGNLHSIGDVQIDGVVNGDISSKTLTVGEGAEVHGAIEAESLRICGTVEGEVAAKTVVLTKTARVYGDVIHESLSVEAGALIHGFCKRLDAPQKRTAQTTTANGLAEPKPLTAPAEAATSASAPAPAPSAAE